MKDVLPRLPVVGAARHYELSAGLRADGGGLGCCGCPPPKSACFHDLLACCIPGRWARCLGRRGRRFELERLHAGGKGRSVVVWEWAGRLLFDEDMGIAVQHQSRHVFGGGEQGQGPVVWRRTSAHGNHSTMATVTDRLGGTGWHADGVRTRAKDALVELRRLQQGWNAVADQVR